MMRSAVTKAALAVVLVGTVAGASCGGKKPPVARAVPPPPPSTSADSRRPPSPPEPVSEPTLVPPEPVRDDRISSSASLDDLNRSSPLKPVFFEYDSADISADAQAVLAENAGILKRYSTWAVTIEGHCDERGTAEYNLALGERRAGAAKTYLVSLGVSADRLRTVSYGKEFPFEAGHDTTAFSKNRRAHFVITAK